MYYSKEDLDYIDKIKFANIKNLSSEILFVSYQDGMRRNTKELEFLKFICFKKLLYESTYFPVSKDYDEICAYLKSLVNKNVVCDILYSYIIFLLNNFRDDKKLKYTLQNIIFKYGFEFLTNKICDECPRKPNCVYEFCSGILNYFYKFEGNILIYNGGQFECYDFRSIRPYLLKNIFAENYNNFDYDKILSYAIGNIIVKMGEFKQIYSYISPDIMLAKENLFIKYKEINERHYTADNIKSLQDREREIFKILKLNKITHVRGKTLKYSIKNISGFIKAFYSLCDGNIEVFDSLAKVFAEIFLGREFLNKEKLKHSNVVVLSTNNANFVKSFLVDVFNFFPEALDLKGQRNISFKDDENPRGIGMEGINKYNERIHIAEINSKLEEASKGLICTFGKSFIKTNTKVYPVNYTVYSLNELCDKEKIGRFIENKIYGCVANIAFLTGIKSKSANLSQFKRMADGKEVVATNYYFGRQSYKSDLKYIFITKNTQDVKMLNEADIDYTLVNLSQKLPEDEYINGDFLSTEEKRIIYDNLIKYGLDLIYCSSNKSPEKNDSYSYNEIVEMFFNECCVKVDANDSDKPDVSNATALKTLNAGFCLFYSLLTKSKFFNKKEINKNTIIKYRLNWIRPVDRKKAINISMRDLSNGFTEEEVFGKNGGTFWIGIIIKNKNEIIKIAENLGKAKKKSTFKKEIPEFIDYIIDKLQINAIKHSNKSDVIIPKSLIDESLSIIQQAVNKAKD